MRNWRQTGRRWRFLRMFCVRAGRKAVGEYSIEMDFKRAKKQAKELQEAADTLDLLAKRNLEEFMAALAGGWRGEGAAAYMKKMIALQTAIGRTASNLEEVSRQVEDTAQRIYNAEMEALEIARERRFQQQNKSNAPQ